MSVKIYYILVILNLNNEDKVQFCWGRKMQIL